VTLLFCTRCGVYVGALRAGAPRARRGVTRWRYRRVTSMDRCTTIYLVRGSCEPRRAWVSGHRDDQASLASSVDEPGELVGVERLAELQQTNSFGCLDAQPGTSTGGGIDEKRSQHHAERRQHAGLGKRGGRSPKRGDEKLIPNTPITVTAMPAAIAINGRSVSRPRVTRIWMTSERGIVTNGKPSTSLIVSGLITIRWNLISSL